MDELADLLAHECRLLEMLLFKLVSERQLVAAGETRFLGLAAAEVEQAMGRLREVQLRRSMLADQLGQPTLPALVRDAHGPYGLIFEDLCQTLFDLLSEIDELLGDVPLPALREFLR